MSDVKVSVIIPAYNAATTIGKALEALATQDYSGDLEIIVLDDGSTDETASVVHRFANVHYVSQENAGPAAARNHGARKASGDMLVFTDSDCIPHKDWISSLLKGFSAKDIGVVAGSYGIANPQSRLARCVHAEIIFRHTQLMGDFPKAFGSYNFCVKKNVFWAVGGFDEGYRNASGEDNDLSYKIVKAGYRIYFERRALVDHYHPTEPLRYMKEQWRHGLWRVKMYAAHPQMARGDGYTYWKDIAEMPLVAFVLLSMGLSALGIEGFNVVTVMLLLFLLAFEVLTAQRMINNFFESIFYGIIIFFRAWFRFFGLSTGIFTIAIGKIIKKS